MCELVCPWLNNIFNKTNTIVIILLQLYKIKSIKKKLNLIF